jgi:hypothetical protein
VVGRGDDTAVTPCSLRPVVRHLVNDVYA